VRCRLTELIAVSVICFLLVGTTALAERGNVIQNGGFEDEFIGGVGKYWGSFHNGGLAEYGFHPDDWDPVVYEGEHSQLIEISTLSLGGSEANRCSGIYQVVDVVAGSRYDFILYGMARSTEGTQSDSEYGYRLEVGFDYDGGHDWQAVDEWIEMPWPEYHRLSPGAWKNYYAAIYPTGDKLTVFVRAWKKFGTARQEGDFNIDKVSLTGQIPSAVAAAPTAAPVEGQEAEAMPVTGLGIALPIAGFLSAAVLLISRLIRVRAQA
jgi:hypothetical protein